MYSVLETEPPDLLEIKRNVPPALASIVKKGLAKRPEDRFQSAAEFSEALESAFSGDVVKLRTGPATTFKSTDALTDLVLPTVQIGIRDYHSDIMPLVERRLRGSIAPKACALLQDAARRTLGYDGLVGLLRSLRTATAQRSALFTVAEDLSQRELEDSDRALLDSHLNALAYSPAGDGKDS